MQQREFIEFDVVIVGAGPSGLSTAIKLKQLQTDLKVCVLEKSAEIGGHILSGAVIETKALEELFPNWQEMGAPLNTKATEDHFLFLSKNYSFKLPTPPQMKNDGNYIISLGQLCKWLADMATAIGVEIFPGFPAADFIDNNGQICGVIVNDFGVDKMGNKKTSYQMGIEIRAKWTLIAEGCRGSIAEKLMKKFNLRKKCQPQTYAIGIKELWEVPDTNFKSGKIIHTIGWPLSSDVYGGSFIYHFDKNLVSCGLIIGLDYENPYLNPYEEMQSLKLHPKINKYFVGGRRISYGARALNEGGFQSIPETIFKGGAIIGCSAGFLNVAKIKGVHNAMKSGILAAESVIEDFNNKDSLLLSYPQKLKDSWIYKELHLVRNIRPGFKNGLFFGLTNAAFETFISRGKSPWTLKNEADHKKLKLASGCKKINYPKHDNIFTFDKLTSVQLTNTNHEEDQPCHLTLKNQDAAVKINLANYAGPEQFYCPAGVYEYVDDTSLQNHNVGEEIGVKNSPIKKLQINAQNCIHCKTCDIKDPTENIIWNTPEGGGGPNYSGM